jgi:hypothetical protein
MGRTYLLLVAQHFKVAQHREGMAVEKFVLEPPHLDNNQQFLRFQLIRLF